MDAATAPGTVAQRFAARRRAWEERAALAARGRSYPARRAVAEPDCALRTPLQRDRDRIVHCKAFRRLKHKTQVFVAPEGDHFRTRLTHTLEVTQIARTVARALGLNEDLVEAIGLGHDLGHPPFGHIGEAVLDALPGRALRPRLSPLRALAAGRRGARARRARGLNLMRRRARRDPLPLRAARRCPRRWRGGSCGSSTASPTSTTTSTTRCAPACSTRPSCPPSAIAVLGDDRLGADRHARPRPRRALRGGRRHRPGRRRSARRWTSCATFMFERVYLGDGGAARAREDRARHPHAVRALRLATRRCCPTAAARPAPTSPSASPTTSPA